MKTPNIRIKICGITNALDYQTVMSFGVDYIGFIFFPPSPRAVTPDQVSEILLNQNRIGNNTPQKCLGKRVGVFVNEHLETVRKIFNQAQLDIVQLCGDESPEYIHQLELPCWKVIRVKDRNSLNAIGQYQCETFLLDTYKKNQYGGTGTTFPPELAQEAIELANKRKKKIIVAGGISKENISTFLSMKPTPFAIDISSSIEESPGKKDILKMKQLFEYIQGFTSNG